MVITFALRSFAKQPTAYRDGRRSFEGRRTDSWYVRHGGCVGLARNTGWLGAILSLTQEIIRETTGGEMYILDARPKVNSWANKLGGAGTEVPTFPRLYHVLVRPRTLLMK